MNCKRILFKCLCMLHYVLVCCVHVCAVCVFCVCVCLCVLCCVCVCVCVCLCVCVLCVCVCVCVCVCIYMHIPCTLTIQSSSHFQQPCNSQCELPACTVAKVCCQDESMQSNLILEIWGPANHTIFHHNFKTVPQVSISRSSCFNC